MNRLLKQQVAPKPGLADRIRRRAPRLVAMLLLLGCLMAPAADSASGLQPMSLQVGFTKYAFSNVNRNDAEAAFKVFVQAIARKRGYKITSTTHVYEDAADFEPEILAGKINLVVVDTWRFLSMNIQQVVTPCFVTANRGNTGKRYVVLTRQGSQLDKLEDLRGKEILEFEVTNANLGRSWLETLLMAEHLGLQETFFSRVSCVNKPSAAVLPVFFGQKPACLVDESGFEVMKELNPQVGKSLQIVRLSEPLADAVICLRNDGWPTDQQKQDITRALAELDQDPAGQQILTLFKIGQLLAYQEAQLDTVKQLREAHTRLRKETKP